MRPEGLSERKTPLTPSGIESATFRLVPQCLKQLQSTINTRNKRAYGSLGMGQVLYFRTCKDKEKLQKGNEKKTAHRKAVPLSLSLCRNSFAVTQIHQTFRGRIKTNHRYSIPQCGTIKLTVTTKANGTSPLHCCLI